MFCLSWLLLSLGCGHIYTNFHKVPQLVASIASFLPLLISLIGENEILNLDGHTLELSLWIIFSTLLISLIDSSSRSEVEEED